MVAILVRASISSALRPKKLHSVYLKIFFNYLQLITIMVTFNLQWPDFVIEMFIV